MKYIFQPIAYVIIYACQVIWFFNHRKAKAATKEWLYYNNFTQAMLIAIVVAFGIMGIVATFYHK